MQPQGWCLGMRRYISLGISLLPSLAAPFRRVAQFRVRTFYKLKGKGSTISLLQIWAGLEKICVSRRRFNLCRFFFPFHATTFPDPVLIKPSTSDCLGMRPTPSGATKGFSLELGS